ncbi:hypothetical protein FBR02_01035 [Anaerolineae bacterium CFX9]|nr:hypothetical protein [Anaerolineae bacterium CFX9]
MRSLSGILAAALLLAAACAPAARLPRLVLLAPFEGRLREIGYNAYYAALLAFEETGNTDHAALLALDDGGTAESAISRARAVSLDDTVAGVILVGPFAADARVQRELGEIPALVVGLWSSESPAANTIVLSHPAITDAVTVMPVSALSEADIETGTDTLWSDLAGLDDVQRLLPESETITLLTSGEPVSEQFEGRYRAVGMFTPPPNHLAGLTYLATTELLSAVTAARTPSAVMQALHETFPTTEGYWSAAPINAFQVGQRSFRRVALDDIIEQGQP